MESDPKIEEIPSEIPQEIPPQEDKPYNKFTDKRFIQPKWEFYAYFMLISTASFMILYIFTSVLQDSLLELFMPSQISLFSIFDLMLSFTIANILWDYILLFALVNILNVIIARVLGMQVGRVFLATLISLIVSVIVFQLVMYLWFYFGDPIGLKDRGIIDYMVELFYYYDIGGTTIDDPIDIIYLLIGLASDLFLVFFYKMSFTVDPSLLNYIITFALAKGFASNIPFELGDLGFNPFVYEIYFEFGIYFLIFSLFFIKYIKPCICITEESLDSQIAEYESAEVFKKEEGEELGKSVVVEKKGKSIEEWEVEK